MRLKQVTKPAALAVSMAAAQLAARADVSDDGTSDLDAEIIAQVKAITEEAEHYCRRAFISQTWRVTLDAFPAAIELPHPPLLSVAHVKFYDADGMQQTLDPQDYLVDTENEPGFVVPAPGKAWPATAARINAVEVQYTCGYGLDESSVPDSIKGYILAKFQSQIASSSSAVVLVSEPFNVAYLNRLLDRYKVYA
jgi:uncharacterized phiE125 gp8 family phage protein